MKKIIRTVLKSVPIIIGFVVLIIGLTIKSATDIIYPERIAQLSAIPTTYIGESDTTALYKTFAPVIENSNLISFYSIIIAIILIIIGISLLSKRKKDTSK